MTKLDTLNQNWIRDCKCSLKKRVLGPVLGHGNEKAKVIFIGEAPGEKEDLEGKPFIGRSGKFLDQMFEVIEMNRKDVYITNTVKYRPPNNRQPTPKEKKDCKEWLLDEINLIKPELIVLLGSHAMETFFPEQKISKVHGKLLVVDHKNISTKKFFVLYHPAVGLYNPKMKKILIKDFKKIPKILS